MSAYVTHFSNMVAFAMRCLVILFAFASNDILNVGQVQSPLVDESFHCSQLVVNPAGTTRFGSLGLSVLKAVPFFQDFTQTPQFSQSPCRVLINTIQIPHYSFNFLHVVLNRVLYSQFKSMGQTPNEFDVLAKLSLQYGNNTVSLT